MADGNRDSSTGPEGVETTQSDATETEAATDQTAATTDGTAESSTADGQEEVSTLDAVTKALESDEGSPASGEAEAEGSDTDDPDKAAKEAESGDDEDLEADPTEEELQSYVPKTRKRIEHLLGRTKELAGRVDALEPEAKAFRDMATFVNDAGLDKQEVNDLFNFGALAKSDPVEAYKVWLEYGEKLKPFVGEVMPSDLQEKVDRGEIPEADAKRMAALEANNKRAKSLAEQRADNDRATEQRNAQSNLIKTVQGAVAEWEAQWAGRDPDSAVKRDLMLTHVRADFGAKYPRNAEEAKTRMNEILARVNKQVEGFRPKQSKEPATPISGGASDRQEQQPTNTLEAVNMALGKT